MQPLRQHTLRFALTNELHARPYPVLRAPEQVSHFALLTGESGAEDDRNHLVCLCDRYGIDPPRPNASHFNADFGVFRLKWERHTEFTTHTVLHLGSVADPFGSPAVRLLPRDWVDAMPGELLVATNVTLETATPADAPVEPPAAWFVAPTLSCSRSGGVSGVVWPAFRLPDDTTQQRRAGTEGRTQW